MIRIVKTHPDFDKNYKKRVLPYPKINDKFRQRLKLFMKNPNNPILKNHLLIGRKKNLRAFSISGDIRVVYYPPSREEVLLLDIGTHNQVY